MTTWNNNNAATLTLQTTLGWHAKRLIFIRRSLLCQNKHSPLLNMSGWWHFTPTPRHFLAPCCKHGVMHFKLVFTSEWKGHLTQNLNSSPVTPLTPTSTPLSLPAVKVSSSPCRVAIKGNCDPKPFYRAVTIASPCSVFTVSFASAFGLKY